VEEIAALPARKGRLVVPEPAIRTKDLSVHIDMLASHSAIPPGKDPVVEPSLKAEFHSFRGDRNLVDHKVRGKREARKREEKFHDKMAQGARLVSDLENLRNRLRQT